MSAFEQISFENGLIKFIAHMQPVSVQNTGKKRSKFKNELQQITCHSDYIITGTCWVAIDYYCQHIKREKNPGVYDIDNIVKPILDGLVGKDGLLIDDVIVNRVTVNWIDTQNDDCFEVEIEYPDLLFSKKDDLIFLKSKSGWCLPASRTFISDTKYMELMKKYFITWDNIVTENDYYKAVGMLPCQDFIYYVKIRDKGYEFLEF